MNISVKKAISNIFQDEDDWAIKFGILTILSFLMAICINIATPEEGAKPTLNPEILICTVVGTILNIAIFGYMIAYLHDLIQTPNAKLPKWELSINKLLNLPIKFGLGVAILFVVPFFILVVLGGLLAAFKLLPIVVLFAVLLFIFLAAILNLLFILYCRDYNFKSIFKIKESLVYFNKHYIWSGVVSLLLGIGCALASMVLFFVKLDLVASGLTTAFLTLVSTNLLAQVYHIKQFELTGDTLHTL